MVDHCGNTCIKLPLLPTEVLPAVLYIGSSELPELLDEPPELLDEPPELPEELSTRSGINAMEMVHETRFDGMSATLADQPVT